MHKSLVEINGRLSVQLPGNHTVIDNRTDYDEFSVIAASQLIYVVSALVIAVFVWASIFKIDQIIKVEGRVMVPQHIQQVQAALTGVIKKMWVKEGDHVIAGQLLVSIESARQEAAVDDGNSRLANLKLTRERLRAEARGLPFHPDPILAKSYADIAVMQLDLYARRNETFKDDLASVQDALQLTRQELKMNKSLFNSGDISEAELLKLERQALELRSQIANRRNRYFQDVATELSRTEAELNAQEQMQRERDLNLKHSEVRSPHEGVVNTIRVYTQGGVVREGEEIMQIVPQSENLIVEARLRPSDISSVKVGQLASVKFDTFDTAVFGSLDGHVSYVSSDSIASADPRDSQTYYLVKIEIQNDQINARAHDIVLRPGMNATVDIQSGQRTVMAYLTKPLSRMMHEALHEK